jgi:23S rRNA (adenine2030-N6)-methyltransferase
VLVDPPFERPNEFSHLAHGIVNAVRKWPTGVYVIWYPVKERRGPDCFVDALAAAGVAKLLRVEIDVGGDDDGLRACGLILINPPWRIADELAVLLDWLVPVLARGVGARSRLDQTVV